MLSPADAAVARVTRGPAPLRARFGFIQQSGAAANAGLSTTFCPGDTSATGEREQQVTIAVTETQRDDESQVPSEVLHGTACRYCHRPLAESTRSAGTIDDSRIYGRPYPLQVRACVPDCR